MTSGPVRFTASFALCLSVAFGQSESGAVRPVYQPRQTEITANDVYVRSGPSLNHYTVSKLNAGDRVTVVGETGDWFEIVPPKDSFSLVSGDYVDRRADGALGIVNGDRVRVRAGSHLNDNKYTVQAMLDKGVEVTIVGSNPDGFLRIVPPEGATLWISKTFAALVPDGRVTGDVLGRADSVPAGSDAEGAAGQGERVADSQGTVEPERGVDDSVVPTPGETRTAASAFDGAPLTPARRTLDEIDVDAHAEMSKPMGDRRLDSLIARYEAVAADGADILAARYAQERVRQLRDVQSIIETVSRMQRASDESESARREFLQQRAAIPAVVPPTPSALDAEGTLRESALYPPDREPRRYRLVDESKTPARTIAYVDVPAEFAQSVEDFLGRRVGLRAVDKSWQHGGVEPIRIYTAGEFVLMDSSDDKPETDGESAPTKSDEAGTEKRAGLDN